MDAPFDLILRYLSEIRSGPWARFQLAVDSCAGLTDGGEDGGGRTRAYRAAEDLAALGHLEVARGDAVMWSVTPPTLVQIPSDRGVLAVLAGARSASLVNQLTAETSHRFIAQVDAPACIELTYPVVEAAAECASRLNLFWAEDFADRLSSLLPSVAEALVAAPEEPAPRNWQTERFAESGWRRADSDRDDGLYRYRNFTTEYRLKLDGRCRRVERSRGIYEWLRRNKQSVAQYDETRQNLRVPAFAGLPPLAGRAAVLCSGLLPGVEQQPGQRTTLVYRRVPPRVARLILASLS